MRTIRTGLALLLLGMMAPDAPAPAGELGGIGVLGDSYSDEYQFYPPDRATARNWVEVLAATRRLDFGRYTSEDRGEPRLQGFAYNWARSGATSDDLIASGQHIGLAEQVSRGEVKVVVIFIGGNDFIRALKSPEPERALAEVLPRALANYATTLRTILDADEDVKVVATTIPDVCTLPELAEMFRSGRLSTATAERCLDALKRYNAQIRTLAIAHPRIAVADFDLISRIANMASRHKARVAGRKLDRTHPGNDLNRLFLADGRHLGMLGQGVVAQMVVNALNVKFSAGIPPLTDREILDFARSVASGPGATAALP